MQASDVGGASSSWGTASLVLGSSKAAGAGLLPERSNYSGRDS